MPDASPAATPARASAVLGAFLAGARIDSAVAALRPDYRVLLLAADGITPGPGDDHSERLLAEAEASVRATLAGTAPADVPHVAAWRDAYRSFGAKPQRTRNSLEALLRRADAGLPRVNRLTDLYNAISVLHLIPLGGEDLAAYAGPPLLTRAEGTEPFGTVAAGAELTEHPEPGEVIWRDPAGVTCRRWNWRQCRRTQLTEHTTCALFVLDALGPCPSEQLAAAGAQLLAEIGRFSPGITSATRLLSARETGHAGS